MQVCYSEASATGKIVDAGMFCVGMCTPQDLDEIIGVCRRHLSGFQLLVDGLKHRLPLVGQCLPENVGHQMRKCAVNSTSRLHSLQVASSPYIELGPVFL